MTDFNQRVADAIREGMRVDLAVALAAGIEAGIDVLKGWLNDHAETCIRGADDRCLICKRSMVGAADMNTGILPNAHRCADCTFTTASADRMDGHMRATGHRHEWQS